MNIFLNTLRSAFLGWDRKGDRVHSLVVARLTPKGGSYMLPIRSLKDEGEDQVLFLASGNHETFLF